MALQCNVTMNVQSSAVGATPPPQATVTVYNPNAVAVTVTGIQMKVLESAANNPSVALAAPQSVPFAQSVPPIGPGQTTTVPATSSITIGPFPISGFSPSFVNGFLQVTPVAGVGSNPLYNTNPAMPPFMGLLVGATVYGSDGSVNEAGLAPLLLQPAVLPPLGNFGGFLQFGGVNNFLMGLSLGAL